VGDWQRALGVWRGYRRGSAGPHRRVGPILYASFRRSGDPGNRQLFVSTTGSDSVTAIDLPKLLAYIRAATSEQRRLMANDLSARPIMSPRGFQWGARPKGWRFRRTANDCTWRTGWTTPSRWWTRRRTARFQRLRWAGPSSSRPRGGGERLFYSARFAFQGTSAAPIVTSRRTLDELSWDLEPDGFGVDIVENRLLEDIADTAPFKWNGSNPDMDTECGPRTEKYFYRAQSYSPAELADVVAFIKSIPLRPTGFAAGWRADGQQNAARPFSIAPRERRLAHRRCQSMLCVPLGSHYTNQQLADVGTVKPTDRSPLVDVPQLTNVASPGPICTTVARTFEEIWTVFIPRTPGDERLSKDELNDLMST